MSSPSSPPGRALMQVAATREAVRDSCWHDAATLHVGRAASSPFIPPCEPTLRDRLPKGEGWRYEVKFDGYRMQIHKAAGAITLYTRNGADWTERFLHLAAALTSLPCKSAIIDAELVHADGFERLITRVTPTLSVDYEVLEATATHYRGHEVGDPFMKFHLDRVTGRLIEGRDIEPTSHPVLMELCDKKITPRQCLNRLNGTGLHGRESLYCMLGGGPTPKQCQRWRSGNMLGDDEDVFSCKPVAKLIYPIP